MFDCEFILIFHEKVSLFPAIYDCSNLKFCKLGMNMDIMKIFPILLTFFHQLVLLDRIFKRGTFLIPYFAIRKL